MNSAAADRIETPCETTDEIVALQQVIAQQQREIQLLQEKIHYLTHQRFGRQSERFNADQGVLFELPTETDNEAVEQEITVETHTRKKRRSAQSAQGSAKGTR